MADAKPENPALVLRCEEGRFAVEGELNEETATAFEKAIHSWDIEPDAEVTLVMLDLDITDGLGIAAAINALRALLERASNVKLVGAPQLLCHNLYRVGLLGSTDRLVLIAMREDEPYG